MSVGTNKVGLITGCDVKWSSCAFACRYRKSRLHFKKSDCFLSACLARITSLLLQPFVTREGHELVTEGCVVWNCRAKIGLHHKIWLKISVRSPFFCCESRWIQHNHGKPIVQRLQITRWSAPDCLWPFLHQQFQSSYPLWLERDLFVLARVWYRI